METLKLFNCKRQNTVYNSIKGFERVQYFYINLLLLIFKFQKINKFLLT